MILLWIVLGIVVFIIGVLLTRQISGGVLLLIIFILWRLGMLVPIVSWLSRIISRVFLYIKSLIQVLKDEYLNKGGEGIALIGTEVNTILNLLIM